MSSYLLFPEPKISASLPTHYQYKGSLMLHPTKSLGYGAYLNQQDRQYYYGQGEKVENLSPIVWGLSEKKDGQLLRTTMIGGTKFYLYHETK